MKSVLPALAVLTAIPFSAACVVVDSQGHITRDEKRFTVSGTPELHLTTFDGAIEIRSGDSKTVLVEIEKRGATQAEVDKLQIDTKQDGNRIDVEVKKPQDRRIGIGIGIGPMSPTAKLIVTMPREGDVVARSGDGSITIERVRGNLQLRTGDGSIRGTDIGGKMTMTTGDGSITLDDVTGDLDVDTGDGSVSVAGKFGAVKLHTGDGTITFRADAGTVMTDDWSMTTGDGGIAVYLPSDFDAQLDAHTGDGSIQSDLKVSADDGDSSRRTLRGKIGDGGKTLKIRTGDGGIKLKTS